MAEFTYNKGGKIMKTTDEIMRDFERNAMALLRRKKLRPQSFLYGCLMVALLGVVGYFVGVGVNSLKEHLDNQAQIEAKKVDTVVEAAFARGYRAGFIRALRGDYDTRYILSNSEATPIGNVIQELHSGALRLVGGRQENAPIGVGSQGPTETIEGGQID